MVHFINFILLVLAMLPIFALIFQIICDYYTDATNARYFRRIKFNIYMRQFEN